MTISNGIELIKLLKSLISKFDIEFEIVQVLFDIGVYNDFNMLNIVCFLMFHFYRLV